MGARDDTFPVTLGTDRLPAGVTAGAIPPATITITSDDGPPPSAGVTVAPKSLTVVEGGAASRTVVLNSHPTGNATMDVDARPLPTDRCWGDLALARRQGVRGGRSARSPAPMSYIGYAGS